MITQISRKTSKQVIIYEKYKNHTKGMMVPAKKPARSAYSLFFNEQKSILAKKNGKWNNKKDGKKVGGMWKVLDDAGKQKYFDDYELRQDTYGKQVEHWEKETRKWREEKRCRLISEGIEVDNQKRMTLQLNPICECDLCCFDKDAQKDDQKQSKKYNMYIYFNLYDPRPGDPVFYLREDPVAK